MQIELLLVTSCTYLLSKLKYGKIYLEMKKCNIYHFFWKNASPKKNYIKRYAQDNGNTGSQYWSCAW